MSTFSGAESTSQAVEVSQVDVDLDIELDLDPRVYFQPGKEPSPGDGGFAGGQTPPGVACSVPLPRRPALCR